MMNPLYALLTPVPLPANLPKIRYGDAMVLMGSCFTEHIGHKLERYKYDVNVNPFGIVYNPVSMLRAMDRIAHLKYYSAEELVSHQGWFHSMDHHGIFSGKSAEEVLRRINVALETAHHAIRTSSYFFLSPGTANVFIYQPTDVVVANCHKIPQTQFQHRRLSLTECITACQGITDHILRINARAHIIWTISPVRHIRDGLIESQRSKATLLLAIEEIMHAQEMSDYFPAYEIMMDELRDYRYYASDMTHPSELAVDLIWDKFADTYLHAEDRTHHPAIEKIKRAMEHRFLHDDREGIRQFAAGQLKQLDNLASLLPERNWQPERQYFFNLLEGD